MEISEARAKLKDTWKQIVDHSDIYEAFTPDQVKKKIKQLNIIIDAMPLEEVMAEIEENEEVIKIIKGEVPCPKS
jgi:SMC interacting uncharacterized protein involved in chromosome segregation